MKRLIVLLTLFPAVVRAQLDQSSSFRDLVKFFIDYIALLLPVVAGLALFVFFKGLAAFIARSGDAKSHADGKNLMIYGILALFAMMSVYGIIFFFYTDFFSRPFGIPLLPPYR